MDASETAALDLMYALTEEFDEIQLGAQGAQLQIIPGNAIYWGSTGPRSVTLLIYWQPTSGEDSRTLRLKTDGVNKAGKKVRLRHPELEETARKHFDSWALIEDNLAAKFTDLLPDDTLYNCKLLRERVCLKGSFAGVSDELTKREKDEEKKVWPFVQPIEVSTANEMG
ncbi:hypothetical protein DL765_005626 [Monosporascus sp. GIB2]|nr:hypothetical protein DL765_005626 [Monosporascus sp. GIB2]